MANLTIDGKKVKAKPGQTILQAARDHNIAIPTLCSCDALKPYGACRVCIVEVTANGMSALEASCTYPAIEGIEVSTSSASVIEARKLVLELQLARCPNVKVIQELAAEYGITAPRDQMTIENEYCILCGLCVRACHEVVQAKAISFCGSGKAKKVDSPFGLEAENCIGCGSCAFVCPTGIIKVRTIDNATENMPAGEVVIGPERVIENWNRNLVMRVCKESGNPFAPDYMLKKFTGDLSLPPQFFDYSHSCRECPEVDEDLCLGCGACLDECPVGAIQLRLIDDERVRSNIMKTHCCGCRTCTIYCVRSAIKVPAVA